MSGPQPQLKILPKAASDIKQVLKYTQSVWGIEQRQTYKSAIDRCIRDIESNPTPRTSSEKCIDGYYRRHLDKKYRHYIFYRVTDNAILIVRMLHDSMDFNRYLP